jgi:hypothetical protein
VTIVVNGVRNLSRREAAKGRSTEALQAKMLTKDEASPDRRQHGPAALAAREGEADSSRMQRTLAGDVYSRIAVGAVQSGSRLYVETCGNSTFR